MTVTTTYLVKGMTCGHCVSAVSDEISSITGVQSVSVDLKPDADSTVSVISEGPLAIDTVRDAVDEAGYAMVIPSP